MSKTSTNGEALSGIEDSSLPEISLKERREQERAATARAKRIATLALLKDLTPGVTPSRVITNALKSNSTILAQYAAVRPNLSATQVDLARNHPDKDVRMAFIAGDSSTDEDLDAAFASPDPYIRAAAVLNFRSTAEELWNALGDKSTIVRGCVPQTESPELDREMLQHIIDNESLTKSVSIATQRLRALEKYESEIAAQEQQEDSNPFDVEERLQLHSDRLRAKFATEPDEDVDDLPDGQELETSHEESILEPVNEDGLVAV